MPGDGEVEARLKDVSDAARGTQNLLYPMREALKDTEFRATALIRSSRPITGNP